MKVTGVTKQSIAREHAGRRLQQAESALRKGRMKGGCFERQAVLSGRNYVRSPMLHETPDRRGKYGVARVFAISGVEGNMPKADARRAPAHATSFKPDKPWRG